MDEYVLGAVADIISGNLTPNRPSAIVKKAKTPVKHQPSPHVTPRSEALPGRDALLSPTLLRKKAVAKKSPKRIFEKEDLDKTLEEIKSPKAAKVKKHLQEDLDSSKNDREHIKQVQNMDKTCEQLENKDTPRKKKKKEKEENTIESLENSKIISENQPCLNDSKSDKKKKYKQSKGTPSEHISELHLIDLDLNVKSNESKSTKKTNRKSKVGKTALIESINEAELVSEGVVLNKSDGKKKKKKSKNLNSEESNNEVKKEMDDNSNDENKLPTGKPTKKKSKKNKLANNFETIENSSKHETESEVKKKKKNKYKGSKVDLDIINSDSDHESDNEIESETEQEVKAILDSGPIEDENSSDEEAKHAPKKSKADKKLSKKQESSKSVDDEETHRTIFVGNVPLSKKTKKEIKKIFNKYGTIESVRIRTVPVKDMRVQPKVAVIKNEIHPDRSSVNVYVKFTDKSSATKALVENNSIMGEQHLRVTRSELSDGHDARRALFVGNVPLGIEDERLRKTFQGCGEIESVRIVRDKITQIGKGFGYVNFASSDGVELALNLTEEDLTIKNRILRVRRYTQAAPGQKVKSRNFGKPQGDRRNVGYHQGDGNNSDKHQRDGKHFGNQRQTGKDEGAFRRIQNKRKFQENSSEKSEAPVKEKKAKKDFVGMTAEKKKKPKKKFDKQSKKKQAIAEILTKGKK